MRPIDAYELEGLWTGISPNATVHPDSVIDTIKRAKTIKDNNQVPAHWIPCSERLPEEDHWLGGSGRQFSDEVMVSVANYDDEDIWIDISQTIDGQWALELPSHCEIIAWIPLPEPYTKRRGK